MEYFGTNLIEAGHYTWNLDGNYMVKIALLPSYTPFNPEELTKGLKKGEVIFYQGGGYTVIGVSGSCIDTRSGTKSIFWVKEVITKHELIEMIKSNKLANAIINQMPFEVFF